MRSDMPKQIMAYRNGGGLPSLATVPMGYSNGGGIFSKLKSGIASIGSQIKSDIKEIIENAGKPISEQSQAYRDKTEASKQRLKDAASRRKKRRKKRRARQAAAEAAAAAAAAAEQQAAANVDGGIMTLDPNSGANNPDVINAYIANILERDDLSSVEKLEFAQSLADTYGVAGQSGMQTVTNSLSSAALDPTSGLSNQERVDTLTSLSPYTDTDYSGLIDTLNNQMAINTIATTTPGADVINNITSTTPSPNLTDTLTTVPEPVSYAQYSPIVPAQNIVPSGIMGLPSSNSYNFTSYVPETFTPAVNSLVLPPLG